MPTTEKPLYGLMAEFTEPEAILGAAEKTRAAGYRRIEAYAPFPVEGLSEAIGFPRDRVALVTLIGGLSGCFGGFFMQWYANVIDYPLNTAGRPFNSWPAFIPVTFELTVLCAALAAAFGMLALNRLPKPYHPVFSRSEFERASRDRFFLCIEASDELFDARKTRIFLETLRAEGIYEVEDEA